MADPIAPSRNKLKAIFPNHDDVIAFERLFQVAGESIPTELENVSLEVGVALANAIQSLSAIERLSNVLDLIALAPIVEHEEKQKVTPSGAEGLARTIAKSRRNEVMLWL